MSKTISGIRRWLLFTAGVFLLLLALAGRADLPMVWAYGAVLSGVALAANLMMDAELLRERRAPGPGGIDRHRGRLIGALFLLQLVVGVLDAGRFHWSPGIPLSARLGGLAAFAAGLALVVRSAVVNRYFSTVVRIQTDRGHTLVTAGPYRFVRHPGYLGMAVAFPSGALALGSYPALLLALLSSALILRRAALEDRYLREELPGYRDYAARVRFRLIPGLW